MKPQPALIRLRIVLTTSKGQEVVSSALGGQQALYEAINMLCMQTELKAGCKLTVVEDD
jgi:hypothetical protein